MDRIMNVIRKIDKWLRSDEADKVLAAIFFLFLIGAAFLSVILD